MNVKIDKILNFIDSQEFLEYLIALILSILMIGFAPSSIAVGIFIFFSIRYSILHRERQPIDLALILPIALYVLFSLTLFWTVDEAQTKKGIDRTVVLLLIPIAFNLIPKFSLCSMNLILRIFTYSNIIFGLFFLISAGIRFLKTSAVSVFTYHELVADLDLNAIYISVIYSISLFYLLSIKEKKFRDILMLVFLGILIILLSSKLILSVLVLGTLIYFLHFNRSKSKMIVLVFVGIIIVGIASKKTVERIIFEKETKFEEVLNKPEFGPVYLWTGTSIRLLQLRILNDQLREEAIFWRGFGLFASKENLKKRHLVFRTYPGFHSYNYHNQYAQILAETGIFGLSALVCMLIVLIARSFNSKNFLFLMFSIMLILVFFTESFLWRQMGLFVFVIFYCLFNRTLIEEKNQHRL